MTRDAGIRRAVLAWYAQLGRDLPWRRTRDPYRILVSEVMLQQTQVARVVPYYERFLERFPVERALARAPAAAVLGAWSGLGYNRRALALRRAARDAAERGWPADAAGLRELPGVGPYTAAAVASFAFGEQVAAVDTNVRRVLDRLDGAAPGDRAPRAVRERAAELLPRDRAATWNHALMDLGATVCTARAPRCGDCPLRRGCRSRGAPVAADRPGASSPRRAPRAERFEATDRYVRGRVVARLVAGEPPRPPGVEAARYERALAALARDGLVVRGAEGDPAAVRLP